jgi:hypothetical protein
MSDCMINAVTMKQRLLNIPAFEDSYTLVHSSIGTLARGILLHIMRRSSVFEVVVVVPTFEGKKYEESQMQSAQMPPCLIYCRVCNGMTR